MKAYGHSRRDKLSCQYGCCEGKSSKHINARKTVDKANRKTARQASKKVASVIDTKNLES